MRKIYTAISVMKILFFALAIISFFISKTTHAQSYCTSGLTYYGCSYNSAIDNFSLSNIHQVATGCSGDVADYTSLTINLARGESYFLSLTSSSGSYNQSYDYAGVWIDMNDNFSFDDEGELLYASTSGGTISGIVSVPVMATLGNHRMRVRLKFDYGVPFTPGNSCTSYYYGEAHDYTVNISAAPSCTGLNALSVSDITISTASVNFGCGGCSESFIVEYGPAGFTPGTGSTAGANGTIINASASPVNLSNLSSSSNYDVYVRRNCNSDSYSSNFGPYSFITKYDYCGTIASINCGSETTANIPSGDGGLFPGSGKELIYSFTPTETGRYTFTVNALNSSITYYIKSAPGGCNENDWTYLAQYYYQPGTSVFGDDDLEAGQTYYIMIDAHSPLNGATVTFQVDCYIPSAPCEEIETITCGVLQEAVISRGVGSFHTTSSLPYGPGREKIFKFTPTATGPYTLTFEPAENYLGVGVFFKKASDGCANENWHFINGHNNTYSPQTLFIGTLIGGHDYYIMLDANNVSGVSRKFRLDCYQPQDPCSNIETISCGTEVTYEVPRGVGAFVPDVCLNSSWTSQKVGKEKIFQFTPSTTGKAALWVKNHTFDMYAGFFFKEASSGCNNNNWQCINYLNAGDNVILPGILTAGTTYYIMADVASLNGGSITFEITCPEESNPCNAITAIACATPVAASIPAGIGKFELIEDPTYYNGGYNGKEIIYSFTATVNGTHQLTVSETDYKPPYYPWKYITYYIKDAAGSCNENDWTKITSVAWPSSMLYSPIYIPYPLIAGHTYYIMLDGAYDGANQTFEITCPEISYPCDNIVTGINCNTGYTFSNPTGLGQFNSLPAPGSYSDYGGKESLFEFTPSITGTYQVELVSSLDYGSVGYFLKESSNGCNNNNWVFIGSLSYPGPVATIPITLTAGTSYYIRADGVTTGATFKIVCPGAEYNPCANITTITACNTPVHSINNSGLGLFPNLINEPYLGTPGKERIFSFTPVADGVYGLEGEAGGSGILSYFIKKASEGCDATGWLNLGFYYGYSFQVKIPMVLKAGEMYYIMTDATSTSGADQTFKITCPSADPCNDITPISVCGWQNRVETTLPAGINSYLLNPCFDEYNKIDGGAKVFSFSPVTSGYYSITEYGSYYADQYFFIKDATLGCGGNDWSCMTTNYYNTYYSPFPLLQGHTYYILVAKTYASSEQSNLTFWLNCTSGIIQYADKDGDGYGDVNNPKYDQLLTLYGYTYETGDCDDQNPAVHPGVTEICGNAIDDNCDGMVDEGCPTITITCPANVQGNVLLLCRGILSTPKPVISVTGGSTLTKLTWTMTGATTGSSPSSGIRYVGTKTFNSGVTTITYTATNNAGFSTTCSFSVTMTDNTNPIIYCPGNITRNAHRNSCSMNINVSKPFFFDNCAVTTLTWVMSGATTGSSPVTGINYVGTKTFNVGVTTITYTAKDAANNSTSCSFTVRVNGSQNCNQNVVVNSVKSDYKVEIAGELSNLFNVYPNPTSNYFIMELNSVKSQKTDFALFDVTGRLVRKMQITGQKTLRFGDDLLPGMYILQLVNDSDRTSIKLVKQ